MDESRRVFDVLAQLEALKRYARSLSPNPADAEDLVHDTLVRAIERHSTLKSGSNLRAWLLSILHNTHVDRIRSTSASIRRDADTALEAQTTYPPEQEHRVRLMQIRKAFDRLPEDQRAALHLVGIEELSYQQAAETLGVPVGTLLSRVSRARAALRDFEDSDSSSRHLRIVGGNYD
jgi:RNA polymerase sigma-70 factor (ECF subfamily)